MALTLVSTKGATTANSYVDRTYCDAYWSQHFNATKAGLWTALSDSKKDMLLIAACRVLETARYTVSSGRRDVPGTLLYNRRTGDFRLTQDSLGPPLKYDYTQSLQFPRSIDVDFDTGETYIPESVMMAQCEQAVHMLSFDESLYNNSLQGLKSESVKVGSIAISQTFKDGVGGGMSTSMLSPFAIEYLKPFFYKSGVTLRRA